MGEREFVEGLVCVVLAGDNLEGTLFAFGKPVFAVDHKGKFSKGHTVDDRDREPADTGFVLHIENGTVDVVTVGVGTVEDKHGLVEVGTGLHEAYHGDVVGIVAEANVLDIDDEEVESIHGLIAGTRGFACVEGEDGDTRFGVNTVVHMVARSCRAAEAVFGGEDSGDVYAVFNEDIKRMLIAHHACVVGEEGYALVRKLGEIFLGLLCSDVYACACERGRKEGEKEEV